jgi:branched-chain amino acid transport system substrate-binding protein
MHAGGQGSHALARWRRGFGAVAGAVAVAAAVALAMSDSASSAASVASSASGGGFITNFVKYADGKPRAANPGLAPVLIGFSSNNAGGTVVSQGPEASAGAESAVAWINKYADGIDGHPLKLDECIVLNAEEEGLACAQKFLNDPKISVISYGALSVGAQTIDAAVAGKKPIITAFGLGPTDITAKNLYVLFGAGAFATYSIGTYAAQYLHAKTAAVVFPNEPGLDVEAGAIALAARAAGIKTSFVAFDPTSSDLAGAFTAAGAQNAGMIEALVTSPTNCLSVANALFQLKVPQKNIVWGTQCQQPAIKKDFPGGDYPKWVAAISQSGSALDNDPTGLAFKKALTQVGHAANYGDPWYSAEWGGMFTLAQFMNKIGYAHISSATMLAAVKAWKGPLLLGGPVIQCGKYRFAPGSCADGNYFFRYEGNGQWKRITGWLEPPIALQKSLEARPFGSGFPTK